MKNILSKRIVLGINFSGQQIRQYSGKVLFIYDVNYTSDVNVIFFVQLQTLHTAQNLTLFWSNDTDV